MCGVDTYIAQRRTGIVPRAVACLLARIVIVIDGGLEAPTGRTPSGFPIVPLDPPSPDTESSTAPGCDGVTEASTCQGSAAVYCSVDRGALGRAECAAIGKACVLDARRGAGCTDAPDSLREMGACGVVFSLSRAHPSGASASQVRTLAKLATDGAGASVQVCP